MKIGIDLDGVVFDSEKEFRVYSELYDMLVLKQNSKVNNKELKFQKRFDWTEEQIADFFKEYHKTIVKRANLMPGVETVLNLLKADGHTLVVITARGSENKDIIGITEKVLKDSNMDVFDGYYWSIENKDEVCSRENVDIMIDDSYEKCKSIADARIKTIYLKDAPCYDLAENDYIKVLYNWGEIYRYIKEIE